MTETIEIGAITLRFLESKEETSNSLDLFEMTLQPGGRMPVPHHHRDWDETIYGLAGAIAWTLDGKTTEVGPGNSLFIRRGVVHGFDNRSGVVATCLCVLTPGSLGPTYFREMAAESARAALPDPGRMRDIMERHGLIPAPPLAEAPR